MSFSRSIVDSIFCVPCDIHRQLYCSGKMKQEMARNDPLDMQPYGMILGTHRRPNEVVDKLLHTDESKHIIIISNNNVSVIIMIKTI